MTRQFSLLRLAVALVGLALGFALAARPAAAQSGDTGWRSPSSHAPGFGGGFETNPTGAYAQGDGQVAANLNGAGQWHDYGGYDFAAAPIPPGSVINGVEVQLVARPDSTATAPFFDVRLSRNAGADYSAYTYRALLTSTTLASYTLGGPGDLWGDTNWSVSDFGPNFWVRLISGAGSLERDFYLDWVAVRVYYTPPANSPAIAISKSPDTQQVLNGGAATFTIVITNTGNVTLSSVAVSDPLAPDCNRSGLTLAAGLGQTYTCTRANVAADFTNTASVSGVSPQSVTVNASDTAAVDVINPALAISKLPDLQQITSGGAANFTIVITNTGDVTVTSVSVTDPLAPLCNRVFASLAPGASAQPIACARSGVTGDFINTANVVAATPLGGSVSASDTASVDVMGPALSFNKTPDVQTVNSGGTATFTLTVVNTGDVPLTDLVITDPLAPDCADTRSALGVGLSWTYSCTLPNVTADITNTASVSCNSAGGTLTASDSAQVRVLSDAEGCPAGLTAFLKLDETQPVPAQYADVFRAHNGVCAGGCPAPAAGRLNGGQSFSKATTTGINVPVLVGPPSFNWAAGDSFAAAFWMKSDPAQSCIDERNEVIVGRTDETGGSQLQFWVGLDCSDADKGKPVFVLLDKGATSPPNSDFVLGGVPVNDGNWHFIVAVRDGAASQNRLYVDGNLVGARTVSYGTGFESPTAALTIGWYNRAFSRYPFGGLIDEVAVYHRALGSGEVLNNYVANVLGYGYCQAGSANIRRLYLPLVAR